MIGDKSSDIKAGQRAGCKTILVKTGYGEQTSECFKIPLNPPLRKGEKLGFPGFIISNNYRSH